MVDQSVAIINSTAAVYEEEDQVKTKTFQWHYLHMLQIFQSNNQQKS